MQRHLAIASLGITAAVILSGCTGVSEEAHPSRSTSSPSPHGGETRDVVAPRMVSMVVGAVDRVRCKDSGRYGDAISLESLPVRSVTICAPKRFKPGYFGPITVKPTKAWQWRQLETFGL